MKNHTNIIIPVVVVLAAGIWLSLQVAAPEVRANDMRIGEFGELPSVADGRVKPLDTIARNNMTIISGRQSFYDKDGKEHPAIEWLLDVMTTEKPFSNRRADEYRVFRIESEQLLNLLELECPRQGFRYSMAELGPKISSVIIPSVKRIREMLREKKPIDDVDQKMLDLYTRLELVFNLAQLQYPLVLPPTTQGDAQWVTLGDGLDQRSPSSFEFGAILLSYARNQPIEFNEALTKYQQYIEKTMPGDVQAMHIETFFNSLAPFYWGMYIYVAVIVLACVSWIGWTKPLYYSAFWLALFMLVVHTIALGSRIYIQGRPPVTNLYSSAIFIGWGCVGLFLVLEYIFRNGIANVGAGVLGFAALFIAHNLGSSGDTMQMMEAVLDTNFWLATHVLCVVSGYIATVVCGFLGITLIIVGIFTPFLSKDLTKALGQATYGVLCFATLLSFTGTVLGGIWADQSWGRFWGWDPKENGAVLIVIWNALILHSRWSGLIKERGMAVLTVFGNMVVAWSYFGTNQLGVGLHAYGFNNKLATGCAIFWVTQLSLIGVGCLPNRFWWSFNAAKYTPPPVKKPKLEQVSV